ncbi:pentapeptide repeat protein [Ktedonobacter racemifer DSM 44963]|uniref:Pentapeptide repeat protein n=1 Tax=Ktedonobacter racemifer DSM 44963 TaxID=485913 RepID=D6TW22_KTERA|nr:pentapeptide repeat protein [Ktedonobacter racemifer DSM 44963]
MANLTHLALLEKGIENWNQWRQNHPEIEPDLL